MTYLSVCVNVTPFTTFDALDITNLKKGIVSMLGMLQASKSKYFPWGEKNIITMITVLYITSMSSSQMKESQALPKTNQWSDALSSIQFLSRL